MDVNQQIQALDHPTLTPLVRQALGRDDAELLNWDHRTFTSLLGPAALSTVHRLTGTAHTAGATRPWSLILKVLTRPANPTPGWDREVLAFRSGLLNDLPAGLAAPHCFAIDERPAAIWLWMEDVAEEREHTWPVDRFALAARHLGRFSGRALVGPLPDAPWLSRAVLRERADQNADFWEGRLPTPDPDLLARLFPNGLLARARQVWDERHQLLDLLDRLPQTLAHGDADRRNLFSRRSADGTDVTAAIDWAWLGIAPLGFDLTNLVIASTLWYQADPRDLPALAEASLQGYVTGLADAGWPGDPRLARLGFAIGSALRYGPCGPVGIRLRYPEMGAAMAVASGHSPDESADRLGAVQRFVLDQLDAARDDLSSL